MKKTIGTTLVISLAAASFVAILALPGCSTLDSALLTRHDTIEPAITNVVTGDVTPAVTNTTYTPNPIAQGTASTIGALPLPWCGTAGALLGAGIAMYANFRNKKLAGALVTGIEAGRQILQTTPEGQRLDGMVKEALINHQEAAGVLNAASKMVNDLTSNTVVAGT
jgi:hypothetical protein